MFNFRSVYAIGVLLLWVMCFATNQMASDPRFVDDKETYSNASTSHYGNGSTFNISYSEVGNDYNNSTIMHDFDRRCFDFFVVSSSFFSVSFALLNVTAINLSKPRSSWVLCMLACYVLSIIGHMSLYKESTDNWLTLSASVFGYFWSFIVVSVLKLRIFNCTNYY